MAIMFYEEAKKAHRSDSKEIKAERPYFRG